MRKFLIAAAALFVSTITASAGDYVCRYGAFGEKECVREDVAQDKTMKAIMPALKEANYPAKIVVKSKSDYKIVAQGWKTTGDCQRVQPMFREQVVNTAKAVYCHLRQHGYMVKKPKIVLAE